MSRSLIAGGLWSAVLASVFASAAGTTGGAGSSATLARLKQLSLEELMAVEVTSVSGMEEAYRDAAAALAVVTASIFAAPARPRCPRPCGGYRGFTSAGATRIPGPSAPAASAA